MTYRDTATSFHVFTGHLKDEMESLNWEAISQLKGTLVFLMGMKNLETIVESLQKYGFDASKPVAIIEWGTHPNQRSISATLATIVDEVYNNSFKAPSVIVVGDVVSFRQHLNFYENLPLFGRNILIQNSSVGKLPKILKDAGANVQTFPGKNKVREEDFSLEDIAALSHILIADTKSWEYFIKHLRKLNKDIRELNNLRFSALGHHTAKVIEESGISLYDKFSSMSDFESSSKDEKYPVELIFTSKNKTSLLKEYFTCPIISTHVTEWDENISDKDWSELDSICLPNSVAAMNFVELTQETNLDLRDTPIIVMGESTSYILEKAGFRNLIFSPERTIESLYKTCVLVVKGE